MADFTEAVEQQMGKAKEGLREFDRQVKEGEKDNLGRVKKEGMSDEEKRREEDPKVKWERGMDTAKDAGSMVIGAGQEVKATAEETSERTSNRLRDAYIKVRLF